jgi:hypothetical protein
VAVNETHGIGTFFDERFDDAAQFPIAAAAKLGHVSVDPDSDRVTGKLALFISINWRCLRCNRAPASISIRRPQLAVTNCSAAKPITDEDRRLRS